MSAYSPDAAAAASASINITALVTNNNANSSDSNNWSNCRSSKITGTVKAFTKGSLSAKLVKQ